MSIRKMAANGWKDPGTATGLPAKLDGGMGFGKSRTCVQVKSGNDPIQRTALDQLVGVMQNVNADQG
jgi:predicted Mrr-cat superfamily restriction endonuclease